MSKTYIPAHYHTPLNVYEMQRAIEFIQEYFSGQPEQRAQSTPRFRSPLRGRKFRSER